MSDKPRYRVPAVMADGFANVVAGIGEANAKQRGATYFVTLADQHTVENAYRASTWFGKVVDIPADDATREWRSWQAESDEIELLEAEEKRLDVRGKVRQALIWSRLYGGAALLPALPGDPSQEIILDRIGKGAIKALTVLHRWEISAQGRIRDPFSPYYGEPEYYTVSGADGVQTRIHPSRVIRITGRRIGSNATGDDVWGDSVWTQMQDAIIAADGGASVISALLNEAKIDVVRQPNLMEGMVTAAYENTLIRRYTLVNVLKSISNTLILDKDDEWSQKQISWGGLPDTVMLLLNIMAGAADIPVTRLLGRSASGLNATGENDLRNYYDQVRAKQTLQIGPAINTLDEMLIRSALGSRNPAIWYVWSPLFQLDEKTRAEIEKLYAEATEKLVGTALIPDVAMSKAVQGRMLESGSWPGLEQGLEEAASDPMQSGEPGALEEEASREVVGDALSDIEREDIIDRVASDPRKPVIERLWRYLARGD